MLNADMQLQERVTAPATPTPVMTMSPVDEAQLRAVYEGYLGPSGLISSQPPAWNAFKAGVAYGLGVKALIAAAVRKAYAEHLIAMGEETSRPADWDAFKAGIAHGRSVTAMAARTVCREDARAEGRRANGNGSERRDNPYPFNSAGYVQWLLGWNEEERHDDL